MPNQNSANRPPYETFKNATCRGCYALGTACGTCEKCVWELSQPNYDPWISAGGTPLNMANEVNWKARAERKDELIAEAVGLLAMTMGEMQPTFISTEVQNFIAKVRANRKEDR